MTVMMAEEVRSSPGKRDDSKRQGLGTEQPGNLLALLEQTFPWEQEPAAVGTRPAAEQRGAAVGSAEGTCVRALKW